MPCRSHGLVLLIALLLVLAGCGDQDSAQEPGTTPNGTVDSATTSASTTSATTLPADDPPSDGPPLLSSVPATIALATPGSGVGPRPLLEWESVPGADHYGVYLYAPEGAVYWAWTGQRTSIHVGGEPRLGDDQPGPRVSAGMTWGVVAYDSSQLPLATSELRPIAP